MKIKNWTQKEITILKKNIEKYGNQQKGCEITAMETGRTKSACINKSSALIREGFTYTRMSNNNNPKNVDILRKYVQENPDNLQRAFKLTALHTGLSPLTIESYWYAKDHNPMSRNIIGSCFMTVGSKNMVNGKNSIKEGCTKRTILKDIIDFIKNTMSIGK